ncbi:hypothetical protein [uncultured Shimia sp.]|nr:hypothetical protein [uncultured Shimia sp.]
MNVFRQALILLGVLLIATLFVVMTPLGEKAPQADTTVAVETNN